MALKLAKETESGSTVEYWRISPLFYYDVAEQRLSARVLAYVSEAARRASKRDLLDGLGDDRPSSVILQGADADASIKTGDPRPALYVVLKARPFFAGAEDC